MRNPPPETLYENRGVSRSLTGLELAGLATGFLRIGVVPLPDRPLWMVCDCCLAHVGKLWVLSHRGFCIGFANAGDYRVDFDAGAWGFCAGCHPLFAARDLTALAARVVTLNPLPIWGRVSARHLYEALSGCVFGDYQTWEAGQPIDVLNPPKEREGEK
jgi:hypothetical protein